jgi:HK97 family phage portal protein
MGLVDRVNQALAEARSPDPAEARAIGGVPWRPWDNPYWRFDSGGPVHPSRSGTVGGVDGALRLQPVYSSVRLLAEGVAMLPIQQFHEAGDGKKVKMPLGQLLSKPSAFLTRFDWMFQYVTSAALQGTAWGLITARDGYGNPTTVEWLPPEDMAVEDSKPWNPAKTRFFFAGRPVSRGDLLIVPAFTIPGRTDGISPLRYFQMLIESGTDALAYGADWYKAGGFPPGVFKNDQYEVEDEQSNAVRAKLVRAQQRREPLVVGRDWTYTPINVPPNEAQFIQAMQLNATQIAGIYGVPPYRVGGTRGDSMTYSNVESENLAFVTDSLDPWLVRLETALDDCLPASQYAQFNRNARLRTTTEARYGVYKTARDMGIMTPNEIRDLEELPPLGGSIGTDPLPLEVLVAMARGIKEIPKSFEVLVTESPADQLQREQSLVLAKEAAAQPAGTPPPPVYPVTQAPNDSNGNGKQPATQGNGHG